MPSGLRREKRGIWVRLGLLGNEDRAENLENPESPGTVDLQENSENQGLLGSSSRRPSVLLEEPTHTRSKPA